ncbi:MAG: hypothetical protein R3E50_03200 [Halioglobus sp.]
MRSVFILLLALPLLFACSDSTQDSRVEPAMAFLSYFSEAQPRGGRCDDTVDVTAPLIVNGFAFNPSNTRNQASLIDSANVGSLAINFHYTQADVTEKRGAPAVTAQAIYS